MIHSALRIDIHNDALVIYWRLVFVAFFFKLWSRNRAKLISLIVKNFIWKTLFEKQRERKYGLIFHLLTRSSNGWGSWHWASLKLVARDSVQVSCGWPVLKYLSLYLLPPWVYISRKLEGSVTDTPFWAYGCPNSSLSLCATMPAPSTIPVLHCCGRSLDISMIESQNFGSI